MLACEWLGGADLQLSGAPARMEGQRFPIEIFFVEVFAFFAHGVSRLGGADAPLVTKTKHYKRLSVQSTFIAGSKVNQSHSILGEWCYIVEEFRTER